MKKTACKALVSLLCALTLLVGMIPLSAVTAMAEMGCDFPWTKEQTLLEKIIERDGLLDGIWYPWINAGSSGHNLTGNEVMAKYYGDQWARVELDYHGADKVYREIYNLKAMGYNMMAWAGSIYGEGVIYDEYGDVKGIKQDYLDNARRLLDMCREIGMPVMWNVYFHCSSAPHYYGMQGWNITCRMLGDRTVADHYAERFVKPLCEMLAEYPDVVALISIADEPANEINDAEYGNHFDDDIRCMYGVNRDDMIYFMKGINDMCKKMLPDVPRTVADNNRNKVTYAGFGLDLMGHNKYDNSANVDNADTFFTDADLILTEYNVGGDAQLNDQQLADKLIAFRKGFMAKGYKGGFQWCWIPGSTDVAYYLLNKPAKSNTDFKETVTLLRHYMDDYRAEYQGKKIAFDTPVLYANDGTGLVEWIPSRNATKVTIERSDDGGKTWKAVLKDADPTSYITKGKGVYKDTDSSKPKSGFCYRVTMSDGKNSATSLPNNKAGADKAHKVTYQAPVIDYPTGTDRVAPIFNKKTEPEKARLLDFCTAQNRPMDDSVNLIKNGSFESTVGAQWNTGAFLKYAKVVSDSTAPEGNKSLYFDTSDVDEGAYYKFTVTGLKPNTNYTFASWVKGDYLGEDNEGHASIGVWDPVLNGFMVYLEFYRDSARGSRLDQQIYPTAWDNEWHLRAVNFNSGSDTEATIALYGKGSEMWVDGIALFEVGDGVTYTGVNRESYLSYSYYVECATCDPAKSVTKNVRMDDTKNTFWQTGDGWRNGFLNMVDNKTGFGRSIKYTGSDDSHGNYYIKWVDIQPNTKYVFSANVKILKSGAGKIALIEDKWNLPQENFFLELDAETFGDEWFQMSISFDSSGFERVGIAICDLGGEALFDNIRLFKVSDAKAVVDPFKDASGSTVTAPVVTVTPTVAKPTGSASKPTGGVTQPTDSTTAVVEPTGEIDDPTATEGDTAPTATVQGAVSEVGKSTTTKKSEDGKDEDQSVLLSALSFKDNHIVLGVILYVTAAAVLATIVLLVVVLLRKKKQTPPTDTPDSES